jgi:hypothetical protein
LMGNNVQYWVSNEKRKQTESENSETSNIGETSSCEDVAVSGLLLVRVRVVQVIVLLDVFWEQ